MILHESTEIFGDGEECREKAALMNAVQGVVETRQQPVYNSAPLIESSDSG